MLYNITHHNVVHNIRRCPSSRRLPRLVNIYIYIYIYMYIYIYVYIYIYTYTYIVSFLLNFWFNVLVMYCLFVCFLLICPSSRRLPRVVFPTPQGILGGECQAPTASFCARRVSPDRRLVQARLARAKKAVATIRWHVPAALWQVTYENKRACKTLRSCFSTLNFHSSFVRPVGASRELPLPTNGLLLTMIWRIAAR